jgi:hypothetical protein
MTIHFSIPLTNERVKEISEVVSFPFLVFRGVAAESF